MITATTLDCLPLARQGEPRRDTIAHLDSTTQHRLSALRLLLILAIRAERDGGPPARCCWSTPELDHLLFVYWRARVAKGCH